MVDIRTITNAIKTVFDNKLRPAANFIPAIIMICSLARRPGLSAIVSFGNIIQDLSKCGLYTDTMPDGTKNMMNILVQCIVKEIFRAFKEDANFQVALAPSAINVLVTGANAAGPVTAQGVNLNFVKGVALGQ